MDLVHHRYGPIRTDPDLTWLVIERWPLPEGWNMAQTPVLILLPPGYPTTPPDNFYVDAGLRTADGGQPGNTSVQTPIPGDSWLMFSHHVVSGDWAPHAETEKGHNLLTFLEGVSSRLSEVN